MPRLAATSTKLSRKAAKEAFSSHEDNDREDRSHRQFITALGRGLDVLSAYRAEDSPLSNRELARRTGLPKPTISRITYTLTAKGFLTYLERLRCYELGGNSLLLGDVARASFHALVKARPAMERLARTSGCNVGLGTRDQLNMVYRVACQGTSLIGLRLDVGSRMPIISSAMGRAFLGASSDEARKKLARRLKRDTTGGSRAVDRIVEEAGRQLAAYGFCVSLGEWQPDIHAAAVPILARELGGLYVLNCGGPAYLLPNQRLMSEIGPALIEAAREIKIAIGAEVAGIKVPRSSSVI